jgi:hypothetical protein
MQSLLVRDSAAVEMPRVDAVAGRLGVNGQALRAIFRPVRAGACVGFGTDRTVSTAASGCEGSHGDGPLRHIRAGVAPKGDKTGIGRGCVSIPQRRWPAKCRATLTGTAGPI